jgi:hypothetical protein
MTFLLATHFKLFFQFSPNLDLDPLGTRHSSIFTMSCSIGCPVGATCQNNVCIQYSSLSSSSTRSQTSSTSFSSSSSFTSSLSLSTGVPISSSSSSTSSPTNKSSPNISTGEVAGIGIACAIAGAILAGLILFFLLSRRNRRKASYHPQDVPQNKEGYLPQELSGITTAVTQPQELPQNKEGYLPQELSGIIRTVAQPQELPQNKEGYLPQELSAITTTVTNVDRPLPQAAEDNALASGLSKIRDGIKNHVQNYYHNAPVDPKTVDQTRLVDVGRVMIMPTSAILDLLLNPAIRIPMIRLFLAHLILSRCVGNTDKTSSFLPGEVAALAVADTGNKNTTAGKCNE